MWRLMFALWTSVFQIYTLPVLGFYPSLALLGHFSLVPTALSFKRTLLHSSIFFLIALMIVQGISLAWSPDKHLGLATVLYEMPFLILFIVTFNIALTNPEQLYKLVKVYAMLSLIPLVLTVFFRCYYPINFEFLRSPIARIFINPNTILWYFAQLNHTPFSEFTGVVFETTYGGWTPDLPNILIHPHKEFTTMLSRFFTSHTPIWTKDFFSLFHPNFGSWTDKPRSFFINPNVGAGYFGICSLLFYGMGTYFRAGWIKTIGILHWLTIFLILSVAASSLAIIIPVFLCLIFLTANKWPSIIKNKTLTFFILFVTLLCSFLALYNKDFLLNLITIKLDSRFILLTVAASLASKHIIQGLGFGGWEPAYEQYRQANPNPLLGPELPPHNLLVQLWSQSGIIAAILGLCFIASLFFFCQRSYRTARTQETRLFVLCVGGAFMWVFLQGMGENWGIVGEMHIQPILAVAFGLMAGIYYQEKSLLKSGTETAPDLHIK